MSWGPTGDPDLLRTDAYDYVLPEGRIARYPSERRDESRLLVVPRGALDPSGREAPGPRSDPEVGHLRFRELLSLLLPGDVLVLNESRVIPVRLLGRKPTGAPCEVLLLRPVEGVGGVADARRWEALVRPGSKLKPGREVIVGPELTVFVEDGTPDGGRIVRLETPLGVEKALERYGKVPLPPYLGREEEPGDRERYQTVYAQDPGSVAAPTAGLHFTSGLLEEIRGKGVELARVSLHVGPGTFRPIEAETVVGHRLHRERWRVSDAAAAVVEGARASGGRVWAVGTTAVRALESAADGSGRLRAGEGETELFIVPGYRFRVVDGLLTNFHLPRSTLLMLVAAFAGYRTTKHAYACAIEEGYRFYSYGDAMAISPQPGAQARSISSAGPEKEGA